MSVESWKLQQCPEEGCNSTFGKASGVAKHLKDVHGKDLGPSLQDRLDKAEALLEEIVSGDYELAIDCADYRCDGSTVNAWLSTRIHRYLQDER